MCLTLCWVRAWELGHGGQWGIGEQASLSPKHPIFLLCCWLPAQTYFLVSAQHHEWPSTEDVEDTALPAISDLAYNVTLDSEKISYFLMSVYILSHLIYVSIFWPLSCNLPWSRVANTISWDIGWTGMIPASCYQSNGIKWAEAFTCMQSFCSKTKYLLVFVWLTSFTCCLCNYGVKLEQ